MRPPSQFATPTLVTPAGGVVIGSISTTGTPAAKSAPNCGDAGSTSVPTTPRFRLRSTRDTQSPCGSASVSTTSSPAAAASRPTPAMRRFAHDPSKWVTTRSRTWDRPVSSRAPSLLPWALRV